MNAQAPNPTRQLARGIAADQICELYSITDPVAEIPLLTLITKTAREYLDAVRELRRCDDAWRRFAAANSQDDPAHNDHQLRTEAARRLVVSLEQQLGASLNDHALATGELSPQQVAA